MVTVTASPGWYLNHFDDIDFSPLRYGISYWSDGSTFRVDYETGWFDQFYGDGFSYAQDGTPIGGIVRTFLTGFDGEIGVRFEGLATPLADIAAVAGTIYDRYDDSIVVLSIMKSNDRVIGADDNDTIDGYGGNDILIGNGGNDLLTGHVGDDFIDGGSGFDEAVYLYARTQYKLGRDGNGLKISTDVFDGTDHLVNVEQLNFVDGRVVFDSSDPAAVTLRMYDAMFGRLPDVGGLNYWISVLQHDTSVEEMATSFAGSAEFVQTYGRLSNQDFVEQLYRNVLDRDGDPSGVVYWTDLLNQNVLNRGQVLLGFSESQEHVAKLQPLVDAGLWDLDETAAQAARIYSAAFDRAPDASGLTFWTATLKSDTTALASIADEFARSSEFANRYGPLTNGQFVDQLYHNVLERSADAGGRDFWTSKLDSGIIDRGDVLLSFAESPENIAKTLPSMADGILLA